jgi:hypothetical protein
MVTATGLLMFAFPEKYVDVLNSYYSRRNFRRRASIEKYSKWHYRLSGFFLFVSSFLIHYELWIQLKGLFR